MVIGGTLMSYIYGLKVYIYVKENFKDSLRDWSFHLNIYVHNFLAKPKYCIQFLISNCFAIFNGISFTNFDIKKIVSMNIMKYSYENGVGCVPIVRNINSIRLVW